MDERSYFLLFKNINDITKVTIQGITHEKPILDRGIMSKKVFRELLVKEFIALSNETARVT